MSDCLICYDENAPEIPCGHHCHYGCIANSFVTNKNKDLVNKCIFCFREFDKNILRAIIKNYPDISALINAARKMNNYSLIVLIRETLPIESIEIYVSTITDSTEFYDFIGNNSFSDEEIMSLSLKYVFNLSREGYYCVGMYVKLVKKYFGKFTEEHFSFAIDHILSYNIKYSTKFSLYKLYTQLVDKTISNPTIIKLIDNDIFNYSSLRNQILKYNYIDDEVILSIIKNDDRGSFKYIITHGYDITQELIDKIIQLQSVYMLNLVIKNKKWDFTERELYMVIDYGMVDSMFKIVKEADIYLTNEIILRIGEKCEHKDDMRRAMEYLYYLNKFIPDKNIMTRLYKENKKEKFKFYKSKFPELVDN